MKSIDKIGHKITLIIIAHRLSTIQNCDQIFLIDNGRLADRGTYLELTQKNKTFFLW